MADSPRVAVIGAGMSGLVCARALEQHGLTVQVFEKSRGVGGRMATRRTDTGLQFDHGAQYFTARTEVFRQQVDRWCHAGVVAEWGGAIRVVENSRVRQTRGEVTRYVGVPGMNAPCKSLAARLAVRTRTRVAPPQCDESGWRLCDESGEPLGTFDALVVSCPAPQTSDLLAAASGLARIADAAIMEGSWAVLAAFGERVHVQFDGAFVHGSPLSWVARNSSKPGRQPAPETWVLHALPEWSRSRLDAPAKTVIEPLLEAFWQAAGVARTEPVFAAAHRWRFALPTDPLEYPYLIDADLGLGACGDWCSGPRVEGAFLSGTGLAERMLSEVFGSSG